MLQPSLSRIGAMTIKEFRHFFRDPVLLILVLWLYTVELAICAVSLTFDLHDVPIAVLDRDRSPESAGLVQQFDGTSSFRVRYLPASEREVQTLLDHGRAQLVVDIPEGYGERVTRGEFPVVQLLADGSNSVTAMTALGDAQRLLAAESMRRLDTRKLGAGRRIGIENQVRVWYNAELTFTHFMVISMIALAAFMVGIIHTAAMIVKEKEHGTLEHLMVTPVSAFELVAAKSLPTFVVGLVALGPAMAVARLFDVPFRGSLFTFALLSAAFLVSAIAIGVAIATLVRTLQQALLMAFFAMFPVMFLSGTMTPIESMPTVLQWSSQLSPLRYYMEALLGVFLKGVGLGVLWPELTMMLALGLVLLTVATALFRSRLT